TATRTIGLDETEYVIALLGQGQQRLSHDPQSRRADNAILPPLQLCKRQLELPVRRVGTARIEVTRAIASQRSERVLDRFELELPGLIDRRHHGMVVARHRCAGRMIDTCGFLHARARW